jgi:outer membrane protein assembly factor BamB
MVEQNVDFHRSVSPRRPRGMMRQAPCAVRRLGFVCALLVLVAGCDWTGLEFGAANTNFNPLEPALTDSSVQHLEVAWSAPCACGRRPLVAGGRVFVLDGFTGDSPYSLTVRAFDATNGQMRWSRPLGSSPYGHVLSAVANGLVYVVEHPESGSDSIVALDEATGVVRWQLTPPEPGSGPVTVSGPLIVDGPLAYVAVRTPTRAGIYALDRAGQVVWSSAPGGYVSALTADPERHILYAASVLPLTNSSSIPLLTGYAEANGALRSAVVAAVPGYVPIDSLGFSQGLVFGTQSNDHGQGGIGAFALHPDTGALVWSGDGNVTAITPNAVVDFHLRGDPNTIARNSSNGTVLWQANTSNGAEAVAGDLVYTVNFTSIEVRRVSDGSVVAQVPVLDTDPFRALTPAAGHLYVVTNTRLNALAPPA